MSLAGRVAAGGVLAVVGAYAAQGAQFRRVAGDTIELPDPPVPGSPAFARLVEGWCGGPLREANRVELLRNGAEIFSSVLTAIAGAQRTIDLSTYIFWSGELPTMVAEALIERADAGVEVNVLVDGWGSAPMDSTLVERFERSKVHFAWYRTPQWYNVDKYNHRTHRRVLVIDGTLGFTGGLGIADEWAGEAKDPSHWRETHVEVEGPAVHDILRAFHDNWIDATGRVLGAHHFPDLQSFDDGVCVQVSPSSTVQGRTAAEHLFAAVILGARERLWFTTAYFAPRRGLIDMLAAAALRGVDVRVVVNGPHIDKEVARRAGHRSYERLLEVGVRVFEYQRTMLHAKVAIADDAWANVGTANFDNRSLALQDELNLSVHDAGIVTELEKHFAEDFDASEEIDLQRWRQRPLASRAYEYASEVVRHSL